ncbi:Tic20 family protein [Leptolyngbya sp. FACHB-17]|uniref:Tic20 family protein n=1 Tax=unclassified Leptolyngbya TaxID=2650499 RepID=UPI0016813B87|nr:Tic20 family protein [Leptolyngbya sp. FACHB-17]MBD2080527.1 hypothetical protein [Leptolyngbya sp. FACHB-17]
MSWRGSTTVSDRIFASLVYLLPLLDVLRFVGQILRLTGSVLSPLIVLVETPLRPLLSIYTGFVPFIVFIALFALVVRNENIPHFIRFNTLQAIFFGIVLSLVEIIWQFALSPVFGTLLTQTLFNAVFLGMIAAVGYSIVQTILGRYAEIPTISDAVYTYVR